MNKRNLLRPYIQEMFVFLFVMVTVIFGLLVTHAIAVKWSFLTMGLLVVVFLWLILYVNTFVVFSIRVLLDCITKSFETVDAQYIEQMIFRSSSFFDKANSLREEERITKTYYYKITVKQKDKVIVLTSSQYFPLEPNKTYTFAFGTRSKAIIGINNVSTNVSSR